MLGELSRDRYGGRLEDEWRPSSSAEKQALLRAAGAARGVLGVTFGHLVAGPLYAFNTHVIPRVVPLVLAMAMFQEDRR